MSMQEHIKPDPDLLCDFEQMAGSSEKGQQKLSPEQNAIIMTAMRELDKLELALTQVKSEILLLRRKFMKTFGTEEPTEAFFKNKISKLETEIKKIEHAESKEDGEGSWIEWDFDQSLYSKNPLLDENFNLIKRKYSIDRMKEIKNKGLQDRIETQYERLWNVPDANIEMEGLLARQAVLITRIAAYYKLVMELTGIGLATLSEAHE